MKYKPILLVIAAGSIPWMIGAHGQSAGARLKRAFSTTQQSTTIPMRRGALPTKAGPSEQTLDPRQKSHDSANPAVDFHSPEESQAFSQEVMDAGVKESLSRPLSELNRKIAEINQKLVDEKWIERANAGSLNGEELEALQQIMNQESILHLARVQKKLSDVERTYL
jgi:hypothetical protein